MAAMALVTGGVVALNYSQASAGSGPSGPSSGSSCASDVNQCHGDEWYDYDISSNGPSCGFKTDGGGCHRAPSGSWDNVKATCSGQQASSVWVFVAFYPNGSDVKSFTYTHAFDSDYGRQSAVGATPLATVQGYFDYAVSIGMASGTWGQDIGWFCWNPSWKWTMEPSTSVSSPTARIGDTVTWTHIVKNTGSIGGSTQIFATNGAGGNIQQCFGSGTVVGIGSGASNNSCTTSYTIKDSDVGKPVCQGTSVYWYSNNPSGTWKYDDPGRCVSIVQDIYGSWGQYAISATGSIKGMASGGALSGGLAGFVGTLQGVDAPCAISNLTLANTGTTVCNGNNMGSYSSDSGMPNVVGRFVGDNGNYYTNTTSLNVTESGVKAVIGTMSIPNSGTAASTIPIGKWLVLDARNQVVNINGDIKYDTSTITNIKDIPQLVILAKAINIAANVKQVDAWLVASDYIDTCSGYTYTGDLSRQVCNQQLLVNGPIMTSHLYMNRTFGEDPSAGTLGQSAERFNLGGDAYLWSMAMASDGSITPVISTELPPRY